MTFNKTTIEGAYRITPDQFSDSRGFFARIFCENVFLEHGIGFRPVQVNNAFSEHKFTIRGMHYQTGSHTEGKLIRCVNGGILDVIIDVRPKSPSYLKWESFTLSAKNRDMLYVPEGCAHGYQSVTDHAEIIYFVSAFYNPAAENGIRWDDPLFGINWEEHRNIIISDKDTSWPDFNPE